MRLRHLPIAFMALFASASAASAAGDAERGRTIAQTWCLPCHAAGTPGATSDVAPSFTWLVENRSPAAITGFLSEPHGLMPNIQLARSQIEDVVAYIESLKRR